MIDNTFTKALKAQDIPKSFALLSLSYKKVNKFAYLYQTEGITTSG